MESLFGDRKPPIFDFVFPRYLFPRSRSRRESFLVIFG